MFLLCLLLMCLSPRLTYLWIQTISSRKLESESVIICPEASLILSWFIGYLCTSYKYEIALSIDYGVSLAEVKLRSNFRGGEGVYFASPNSPVPIHLYRVTHKHTHRGQNGAETEAMAILTLAITFPLSFSLFLLAFAWLSLSISHCYPLAMSFGANESSMPFENKTIKLSANSYHVVFLYKVLLSEWSC